MVADTTRSVGAQGLGWAVLGSEATGALYDLRWMLIFMLVLIMTDFWWGCRELKMKRDRASSKLERDKYKFHFSRAGRRTLNKVVDYLTYLLLGCVVGFAVTEPLDLASHITTAAIGIGAGCLFELASITGHVFATHDLKLKINWKRFVVSLVKSKSEELGDAIDSGVEIGEDDKKKNKTKSL